MGETRDNGSGFADLVRGVFAADASPPSPALTILKTFCEDIQRGSDNALTCRLERGYPTNLGQQWRVMVQGVGGGSPQVLLRAYVKDRPPPLATLDVFDEAPIDCDDEAALRAQLRRFLNDEGTRASLRMLAATP